MILGDRRYPARPTARHHRRFVSADEAVSERPPQRMQQQSQTMAVICPKCGASFRAPRGAGVAFCRAGEPPYFGPKRGCGWFLAMNPPAFETSDKSSVDAVMDCMQYWRPERNDFVVPDARQLFARVYERWERRGYGKVEVREDGSLDFHRYSASEMANIAAHADGSKSES